MAEKLSSTPDNQEVLGKNPQSQEGILNHFREWIDRILPVEDVQQIRDVLNAIFASPEELKEKFQSILSSAGIEVNGNNPWDIQVHNEDLYRRLLSGGSLAAGESYMDGWWDCEQLDEFFNKLLRAELEKKFRSLDFVIGALKAKLFNLQNPEKAFDIGEAHYDAGNDLYQRMLDDGMVYTCGYWKDAENLDEAQEAKLDLVCRKLGLKAGDRVLDIGCGFGSFSEHAAEEHKVESVGITVSKEQVKLARESCKGLPIEIRLQDYRDVNEQFDHIVSLGMIEHVGYKNYRHYMEVVNRCLKDDGLFLLQTIGGNMSKTRVDPWFDKYIFPGGMLPSIKQIGDAIEGLFVMEDWHNFGPDYDKTLMAWHENFEKSWNDLKKSNPKYDERFRRMWRYYLLSSAGAFRSRRQQLWQIVLSKKGIPGGYTPIR